MRPQKLLFHLSLTLAYVCVVLIYVYYLKIDEVRPDGEIVR
jgi:hypothetical protein